MSHFQDSLRKKNRICSRDAKCAKSGGQCYNFNLPLRRYGQAILSGGRSSFGLGGEAEGARGHFSLRTVQQPAFRAEPRCELRTRSALAERNPTEQVAISIRNASEKEIQYPPLFPFSERLFCQSFRDHLNCEPWTLRHRARIMVNRDKISISSTL